MDKSEKMEIVAEHTARIVLQHGLPGITHSKIARASHVSRPWLYKYLGREHKDLIRFTTRHFGLRLAKFDRRPRTDSRQAWIEDTADNVRTMMEASREAPWVLPLYFRYVGTDNAMGQCVAEVEARYLTTAAAELATALGTEPVRSRRLTEMLHAARMGIVHRWIALGSDDDFDPIVAQFRVWLETL